MCVRECVRVREREREGGERERDGFSRLKRVFGCFFCHTLDVEEEGKDVDIVNSSKKTCF